jgi:cell division protein FtsL
MTFELHEKRTIYITAAIGIVLLLVGGLAIFPKYRAISRVNKSITEARTQLELKYEKTKRLHKSQISLAAVQKIVDVAYGRLLKRGQELQFILALEDLAERLNLSQNLNLAPTPRRLQKGLAAFGLDISVTGHFRNLLEYLEALEKNQYPMSVADLEFSSSDKNVLTATIKAEVYVED